MGQLPWVERRHFPFDVLRSLSPCLPGIGEDVGTLARELDDAENCERKSSRFVKFLGLVFN